MKITLHLTLAEAQALSHAAGNSLVSDEDAMAIMLNKQSVTAAYRAAQKLNDAIAAKKLVHKKP